MCTPLAVVYLPWVKIEVAGIFGPSAEVAYVSNALLGEPIVEVAEGCGINAHVVDDWFECGSVLSGYGQPCGVA